jgi:hypothetical protein
MTGELDMVIVGGGVDPLSFDCGLGWIERLLGAQLEGAHVDCKLGIVEGDRVGADENCCCGIADRPTGTALGVALDTGSSAEGWVVGCVLGWQLG